MEESTRPETSLDATLGATPGATLDTAAGASLDTAIDSVLGPRLGANSVRLSAPMQRDNLDMRSPGRFMTPTVEKD
ncbi:MULTISPECIES: hypothetical protein [unclassified Halomonas]|uniref:hypothetical protein n=1 Tax=unclassified Halomonas TaxID=2609666 RepID=UPI0009FEC612|nr:MULTISPECIES: hypothetical protein [unclassified Halomonas]